MSPKKWSNGWTGIASLPERICDICTSLAVCSLAMFGLVPGPKRIPRFSQWRWKICWNSHQVYQQHFDTFTPGVSKYHITSDMLNLLPILFDGRGSAKFLGHLHPNHSATWPLGGLSWASWDVLGFPQLPRTVRYMVLQCITIVPGWLTGRAQRAGCFKDWKHNGSDKHKWHKWRKPNAIATRWILHLAKYSQKTCTMVLHTDYVPSTTKPEVQAGCIHNCIIQ